MARRKSDGDKKKKKTPPPAPKTRGRRKKAWDDDDRLDGVLDINEDDENEVEDDDLDDEEDDYEDEDDDFDDEDDSYLDDEDDDLDKDDDDEPAKPAKKGAGKPTPAEKADDEDYFGRNDNDLRADDADTEDYFGEREVRRKADDDDDEHEEGGRRRRRQAVPPAGVGTKATAWGDYLLRLPARVRALRKHISNDPASDLPSLDLLVSPLEGGVTVLAGEQNSWLRSLALQMCLTDLRADPALGVVYLALDDPSVDTTYDMIVCSQSQVDITTHLGGQMTLAQTHRVALAEHDLSVGPMRRMRVLGRAWHEGTGLDARKLQRYCQDFMQAAGVSQLLLAVVPLQGMALPSAAEGDGGTPAESPPQALDSSDPDQWRLSQVLTWHEWSRWARDEGWPALLVSEGPKAVNDALLAGLRSHPALRSTLELQPSRTKTAGAHTVPAALRIRSGAKGEVTDIALMFHYRQYRVTEAPGRD